MTEWLPTLVAVVLLTGIAILVMRIARLPAGWQPIIAVLRCVLQLAIIALILGGVITSFLWVTAALAVMFIVAASTSTKRLGFTWRRFSYMVLAMLTGVLVTMAIIFITGALPFEPRYLLALGGIIVGNTMSVATLAGRRFYADLHDNWEQAEGWLALGARPRDASKLIRRQATFEALVPHIDQTKTTGLVTLPGSFVGAIFGGASPIEAGKFQVLVLTGVITAGTITAVLLLSALAPVRQKPAKP